MSAEKSSQPSLTNQHKEGAHVFHECHCHSKTQLNTYHWPHQSQSGKSSGPHFPNDTWSTTWGNLVSLTYVLLGALWQPCPLQHRSWNTTLVLGDTFIRLVMYCVTVVRLPVLLSTYAVSACSGDPNLLLNNSIYSYWLIIFLSGSEESLRRTCHSLLTLPRHTCSAQREWGINEVTWSKLKSDIKAAPAWFLSLPIIELPQKAKVPCGHHTEDTPMGSLCQSVFKWTA